MLAILTETFLCQEVKSEMFKNKNDRKFEPCGICKIHWANNNTFHSLLTLTDFGELFGRKVLLCLYKNALQLCEEKEICLDWVWKKGSSL